MHEIKTHKAKKNFKVNADRLFLCELCPSNPTSFHTKLDKIQHLASKHFRFIADYCPTCKTHISNLQSFLKGHAKYHESQGKIDWLDTDFYPFMELIKLLKNQKFVCSDDLTPNKCILEQPKIPFHCPLCTEDTKNEDSYQKHINQCIFKNRMGGGKMTTRGQANRDKEGEQSLEVKNKDGEGKKQPERKAAQAEKGEEGVRAQAEIKDPPEKGEKNDQSKIEENESRSMSPKADGGEIKPIIYSMTKRSIRRGVGELISFKSKEYNDDLMRMFFSLRNEIKGTIKTALQTTGQIKVVPNLITLFEKENPIFNSSDGSLALTKLRHLLIPAEEINLFSDLDSIIDDWLSQFENKVEQFCENESGFYVLDFVSLQLKIFSFKSFANAGQLRAGFQIPPSLAKILGMKWRQKMLYPQNSFDADCILYCIAIQLQAMKNNFCQSKNDLVKLNISRDFDVSFLSQYCPAMIDSLKIKLKNIRFPLSLSKMWILNFIKAIDLPQYCINFFYFDEEKKHIIPLHVANSIQLLKNCLFNELGPQYEAQTTKINKNNAKNIMTNFENHHIDLLCYPSQVGKTGEFHCALILNFYLTIDIINCTYKRLQCRKCYSSFSREKGIRSYLSHLLLCEQYNKDNLTLVFPQNVLNDKTGKLEPPKLTFNECLGREKKVFHSVIDFETRFVHSKDGQREMVPAMGFYFMFLNVKIFKNDSLQAKRIKQKPFPYLVFEGNECAEKLLMHYKQNLLMVRDRIDELKKIYSKCILSKEDEERVRACVKCERCGVYFSDKRGKTFGPIRDHCYYQPNVLRALLCSQCNMSSRVSYTINLTGFNNVCFDNKIIMKAIFSLYKQRTPFHFKINVIPLTMENYLCIRIHVFCDQCHVINKETGVMSFAPKKRCNRRHMIVEITDARKYWNTSLDSLIKSYCHEVHSGEKKADEVFPMYHNHLKKIGLLPFIDFDMAIQKQFFPYDHWTATKDEVEQGIDTFLDKKCLPPRETWKNSFWKEDEILGENEYAMAQQMWDGLSKYYASQGVDMTMRLYTFFYQISDVMLLADILASASNRYFDLFQLEILAFPSLASFSQAIFMNILQKKNISIELITNPDIYLMAKNACVGGLVGCGEYRFLSCNNPLLPDYDEKKPISILKNWDVNALYTSIMQNYAMPRAKYRLLNELEIKQLFLNITENQSYKLWDDDGYRSELDVESGNQIPFGFMAELTVTLTSNEYKEKYEDIPLFEEKRVIPPDWLSPYQRRLYAELGQKLPDKTPRIMLTLHEKTVFCDFRYLRFALELGGYKVVAIKRVIEFELSPFMRPYMDEFIKMRKNSKTKVENQMAKNLCNIQFGKKLESKEGRLDCTFIFSDKSLQKMIKCPQFSNYIEYNEEVGVCVRKKKRVYIDTLPLVGFTILSLSKLRFMKNIYSVYLSAFIPYKIRSKVVYWDTDGANIYHELDKKAKSLKPFWDALRSISGSMDLSDFPTDHVLFSDPSLSTSARAQLIQNRENNRKQIGLFSSEIGDRVVKNAAFIQPKSYCINFTEGPHKVAMKGARLEKLDLKMDVLNKFISGECGKHLSYDHVYIHSMRQSLFISKTQKNILSRLYVKRYMLDGNRSLSYGHPLILIHQIINEMIDEVVRNVDNN